MNVVKLSGGDLDGGLICCKGSQMALVLQAVLTNAKLRNCTWYAAAIETYPPFGMHDGGQLKLVEDIASLIERIDAASQLLDGVIISVPGTEAPEPRSQIITANCPMEIAVGKLPGGSACIRYELG